MQLAHRPRRDVSTSNGGGRIGYAWFTEPDGVLWHNGGTGGFRSFLGLDDAHQRAIVVLANGYIDAVDALGFHALDPKLPLPAAPTPDAEVAPGTLERYIGRYRFSDGSIVTVTRDERGLIISFDRPVFRARLHATSPEAFVIRAPRIDVRFEGTGQGATLTVSQPGQPTDTGKRIL